MRVEILTEQELLSTPQSASSLRYSSLIRAIARSFSSLVTLTGGAGGRRDERRDEGRACLPDLPGFEPRPELPGLPR